MDYDLILQLVFIAISFGIIIYVFIILFFSSKEPFYTDEEEYEIKTHEISKKVNRLMNSGKERELLKGDLFTEEYLIENKIPYTIKKVVGNDKYIFEIYKK